MEETKQGHSPSTEARAAAEKEWPSHSVTASEPTVASEVPHVYRANIGL